MLEYWIGAPNLPNVVQMRFRLGLPGFRHFIKHIHGLVNPTPRAIHSKTSEDHHRLPVWNPVSGRGVCHREALRASFVCFHGNRPLWRYGGDGQRSLRLFFGELDAGKLVGDRMIANVGMWACGNSICELRRVK